MPQKKQSEQMTKVGNWIAPLVNKYESVLVLLFVIGLFIKTSTDLSKNFLIIISLSVLIVLYYLRSFYISDEENIGPWDRFADKLSYYACCVGAVGILFRLGNWPGYRVMVLIGCMTISTSLIAILYCKIKKPELKLLSVRLLVRVILIGAICFFLLYVSSEDLVKYKLIDYVRIETTK